MSQRGCGCPGDSSAQLAAAAAQKELPSAQVPAEALQGLGGPGATQVTVITPIPAMPMGQSREWHQEVKCALFCRGPVPQECVWALLPGWGWHGAEQGLSSVPRVRRHPQRHHHQLQGPAEVPGE